MIFTLYPNDFRQNLFFFAILTHTMCCWLLLQIYLFYFYDGFGVQGHIYELAPFTYIVSVSP